MNKYIINWFVEVNFEINWCHSNTSQEDIWRDGRQREASLWKPAARARFETDAELARRRCATRRIGTVPDRIEHETGRKPARTRRQPMIHKRRLTVCKWSVTHQIWKGAWQRNGSTPHYEYNAIITIYVCMCLYIVIYIYIYIYTYLLIFICICICIRTYNNMHDTCKSMGRWQHSVYPSNPQAPQPCDALRA